MERKKDENLVEDSEDRGELDLGTLACPPNVLPGLLFSAPYTPLSSQSLHSELQH